MQRLIIFFLLVVFIISCEQKKKQEEVEEVSTITSEGAAFSSNQAIPQLKDDIKVQIYELQEKIKLDPENPDLRKQYCETAYQKDQNVFFTMGVGLMVNPQTGDSIPRAMYERAAQVDASRWGLYAETWLRNNYQPDFGKIKGDFKRFYQVSDKVVVDNSFFLYLAIDMSD